MHFPVKRLLIAAALLLSSVPDLLAQTCPGSTPVQGAPVGLQVFPADNWWNTDVRNAPVDPNSAAFINFIGSTRGLHPDFGGTASPGSTAIYGIPYAIVDGAQAKSAVDFEYWDESDGVDRNTGAGVPFYPIPAQAMTERYWIEGGPAGNVDARGDTDRHLLMIDCTNHHLYELYHVYYNQAQNQWYGVSGAFFDLDTNDRRPQGWTSADASGMAVFPGLVRYDEAGNPNVAEINHALRVTLRASNGHVFPASHSAGSTAGALPMGARLRLKTSVNGADPALRTSDPVARKIFRAMQKYGLIMADNGSDLYISGTFDLRWNNGTLNPAFSAIKASDFEVVQLGWKPPVGAAPTLSAVSASPNPVYAGQSATGMVTLTAAAPSGGARVTLSSASPAFVVPTSVTVAQGATSAAFNITTPTATTQASGTLSAAYAGVTRTTTLTVSPTPPAVPNLSIRDAIMAEGNSGTRLITFNVRLNRAPSATVSYTATTVNGTATAGSDFVSRTATQTIAAGQTSGTFTVTLNGDTVKEKNERFLVNLSAPSNAVIGDGQAVGTILNDEGRIAMPKQTASSATGNAVANPDSHTPLRRQPSPAER